MTNIAASSTSLQSKDIMINQVVNFSGVQKISKVTLDITVVARENRKFITGEDGAIAIQAGNWQTGHNVWTFQPIIHWTESNNWKTSGASLQNTFQSEYYLSNYDASQNAPYLEYSVYIDEEGTYDLWGYGYTNGAFYWQWQDQEVHASSMDASTKPRWQKLDRFKVDPPGLYTFRVYLGSATITVFDEWYLTKNTDFQSELDASPALYTTPITPSKSPFNTAVRLRSIYDNQMDSIENPYNPNPQSITSWLPGINISGKYNYTIQQDSNLTGIDFVDGVSIDFWQIGGDSLFFCAWNYIFTENSVGNSNTINIPDVL